MSRRRAWAWGGRVPLPLLVVAGPLTVFLVGAASGWGGPSQAAVAADLGPLLAALVATGCVARASRRCSGFYRSGWACLGLALAAFSVGETCSLGYALSGGAVPPALRDAIYLPAVGLGLAGLGRFVVGDQRVPWARLGLDLVLTASSLLAVSWVVLLEEMTRRGGGDGLRPVYPVLDVGFAAVAVIMTWRASPSSRASVGLLGAAAFLMGVGDSAISTASLYGVYQEGGPLDAFFLVGLLLGAVAATRTAADPRTAAGLCPSGDARAGELATRLLGLAPQLAFVVACLSVLLAGVLADRPAGVVELVLGSVALGALFARQSLLSAEEARLRRELATREQRFRSLVQGSSDAVAVVGSNGRFSFVSPSVRQVWGYQPEQLVGQRMVDFLHPDDEPVAARLVRQMLAPDWSGGPVLVRTRTLAADGGWRHMETAVSDHRADPAVGGLVYNSRDVTEQVALQEQLGHLAFHDALTGLPNRARFLDRAEHALAQRHDNGLVPALLFLDLDGFKAVNDSSGHAAGDELLVACAERLRAAVRPGDTVARLGGDEFAALLDRCDGPEQPLEVARRILDALAEPFDLSGRRHSVSASIGVALGGTDQGAEQLLRSADLAMYDAKATGKGRVVVHAAMAVETPVVVPAQTPPADSVLGPATTPGGRGR